MTYLYLLLAILLGIIIYFYKLNVEGFGYPWKLFNFNSISNPSYCPECGKLSKYGCGKCVNCGYCISSRGYGECVPGDAKGPYFRDDCVYYEHGSMIDFVNPFAYYHIYPTVSHPRLGYLRRRFGNRNRSNRRRRNKRRHSKNIGL